MKKMYFDTDYMRNVKKTNKDGAKTCVVMAKIMLIRDA